MGSMAPDRPSPEPACGPPRLRLGAWLPLTGGAPAQVVRLGRRLPIHDDWGLIPRLPGGRGGHTVLAPGPAQRAPDRAAEAAVPGDRPGLGRRLPGRDAVQPAG